jgi:hypothetical protein
MTSRFAPSTAVLVRAITESYPVASTVLRKSEPGGLEAIAEGMERYLRDPKGYASSASQLRQSLQELDRVSGRKAPLPSGHPSAGFDGETAALAATLGIDPWFVETWRKAAGEG